MSIDAAERGRAISSLPWPSGTLTRMAQSFGNGGIMAEEEDRKLNEPAIKALQRLERRLLTKFGPAC
jgi:hypothetical protein